MANMMKAAVMTANNKVELVQRPIPEPGDDEVLVKLEYSGVCGSDLHLYEKAWGNLVKEPHVLGHEAAGTVVKLGRDVRNLEVGDRVALEPGSTCGKCFFCKTGRYNLCPHVLFFAAPPVPGTFQEYREHKADLCFKLPDNISTLEGALIEPLAVGLYASAKGEAGPGQTAVVIGSGCIGLVTLMSLKIAGVAKTIVIDVLDNRLAKASELGADCTINGGKEDVVARIRESTAGEGCDLAIDTSGSDTAVSKAVEYCKMGATIVLVGYSPSKCMTLPTTLMADKELTVKTIFRYRNVYPLAIRSAAAGRVNLKSIVSNIYTLDDIQNGLDASVKNKAHLVKTVIKIG